MTLLFWLASAAILTLFAMVPLDWKSQAELGLTFFAVAVILGRISRGRRITLALIALSIFSSTRYIYWRIAETIRVLRSDPGAVPPLDLVFVFLLLSAEIYAFVILLLGYVQTISPLKRLPFPLPRDQDQWPDVDIFVPTYNESLEVVRPDRAGRPQHGLALGKIPGLHPGRWAPPGVPRLRRGGRLRLHDPSG